jgi:hypothetical protein
VLVAASARGRRRADGVDAVATLVEDVFAGGRFTRALPDAVTATLESLEAARRGGTMAAAS